MCGDTMSSSSRCRIEVLSLLLWDGNCVADMLLKCRAHCTYEWGSVRMIITLILENLYYYLGLSNSYATFGGLAYKGYTSSGTKSAVRLARHFGTT